METYKDSVYSCKTGGTPANIDGDEGQEHHRAPGTGGIFNHSSLGRETVLNLSSIEVTHYWQILAKFLLWVFFFLFTRGSLFVQEKSNPFLDHVFSHELSASLHSYVLNKSSHWTSVLDFILSKRNSLYMLSPVFLLYFDIATRLKMKTNISVLEE